jgi:hypothetical protein
MLAALRTAQEVGAEALPATEFEPLRDRNSNIHTMGNVVVKYCMARFINLPADCGFA